MANRKYTPAQRRAVVMDRLEMMTYTDIAEKHGIPYGSVSQICSADIPNHVKNMIRYEKRKPMWRPEPLPVDTEPIDAYQDADEIPNEWLDAHDELPLPKTVNEFVESIVYAVKLAQQPN